VQNNPLFLHATPASAAAQGSGIRTVSCGMPPSECRQSQHQWQPCNEASASTTSARERELRRNDIPLDDIARAWVASSTRREVVEGV
jgi:hypothetical protein